jgi:hypothetical protein
LERVDDLFGLTTWKQYAQFVKDNVLYNGHKHLRELNHVAVESANQQPLHLHEHDKQDVDYTAVKIDSPGDDGNFELTKGEPISNTSQNGRDV